MIALPVQPSFPFRWLGPGTTAPRWSFLAARSLSVTKAVLVNAGCSVIVNSSLTERVALIPVAAAAETAAAYVVMV